MSAQHSEGLHTTLSCVLFCSVRNRDAGLCHALCPPPEVSVSSPARSDRITVMDKVEMSMVGISLSPSFLSDGRVMSLAFVHVSAQYHFVFWLPGSLHFISDKMQDIEKWCMEKHSANIKGMADGLGWWPSGCSGRFLCTALKGCHYCRVLANESHLHR